MIRAAKRHVPERAAWMLAALFFALWAVLLTPGLLAGSIPWDERFSEYIPWRMETARIILGGEFPHFTSRLFAGMPLFSQGYAGVLYPPNLLYLTQNPFVANWIAAFHLFAGAMGMLMYLRAWRIRWLAACVGAAGFAALAFHANHAAHVSMREAALLTPWVAWAARVVLRGRNPRAAILFAIVLALQLSIGYAQVVLLTGLWVLAEFLAAFVPSRRGMRALACLALGASFAIGLTAVQLLPMRAHAEETPRVNMTIERWQESSFPPDHALLFLNPRAFGNVNEGFTTTGSGAEVVAMAMPAINMLSLVMIGLLAFRRGPHARRRWVLWIAGAWFVSLLLTLGEYFAPNAALFHVAPFSYFRIPSRWFLISGALGCVMAAQAIHIIQTQSRFTAAVAAIGVALGYALLYVLRAVFAPEGVQLFPALSWTHFLPVGILVVVLGVVQRAPLAIAALLLAMMIEAVAFTRSATPTYTDHAYVRGEAARPILDSLANAQRIYALHPHGADLYDGLLLPHNTAVFRGIPTLSGYTPLMSARLHEFTAINEQGRRPDDESLLLDPTMLRHLGVSHVMAYLHQVPDEAYQYWPALDGTHYRVVEADDQAFVLEVLNTGARFQPATRWATAMNKTQEWESLREPSIPLRDLPVVISGDDDIGRMSTRMRPDAEITLEVLELKENRQRMRINATGDGVLLVRDVWWPGWRYRFAGIDAEGGGVLRGNAIFRAVPMPQGEYELELYYRLPGFRRGLAISLATLLLMLSWWISPWCAGRSRSR